MLRFSFVSATASVALRRSGVLSSSLATKGRNANVNNTNVKSVSQQVAKRTTSLSNDADYLDNRVQALHTYEAAAGAAMERKNWTIYDGS